MLQEKPDTIYLRPETAQGIFVNFLNVQKTGRMKIPFGIAQTGKAFEMKLLQGSLFSACVNLNKWKCNFLSARHRNGMVQLLERRKNKMA